jgi:cysteine desulfurase/selenocysteine lyase
MTAPRLGDRSLFPQLDAVAYLAHAAISPLSAPVCERIREVSLGYAEGGMAGFVRWTPPLQLLREQLASLIGAQTEDIGFVSNTTHGVIDIAFSLPWKPGDRVLLFEGEFPANVTPWQRAAAEFDLELCWLGLDSFHRSAEEGLSALRAELDKGIRLVAVSAVQYKTGLRMPLAEMAALCREHGAELFVDAIQSVGVTPVDVSCGIDYLSSGSHKGLMGAEGAGFVYVAPSRVARLQPRLAGWLSHEDPAAFLIGDHAQLSYDKPFRKGARFFEIGTPNVIGLNALSAAVDLITQLGVEAIHAHCNRYIDALEAGLRERGFRSYRSSDRSSRSTLLSVQAPDGTRVSRLATGLRNRGVICNTPDGLMRFSPHWPNAASEVPGVLEAVDGVLR